jgi:hypothetical protein
MTSPGRDFPGRKTPPALHFLGVYFTPLYTSERPDFLLESASIESRQSLFLNDLQTKQLKPSRQIRSISTRKKV